ncbi:ATP-grasp fold amidoligase family protein [Sphingomonas arenae]|uniref:ATP-grasp fold amidoligase family protein n=1 Tax=Sphingomonas arenae TaxID=2812555 RepID=UPI001966D025|nr:ATP-grasp fold amidoligase family protein [Sphingomonas arenae]
MKTIFRAAKAITPGPVQEVIDRGYTHALQLLPLRTALQIRYFKSYQRWPRLDQPVLFSEKCQALKLLRPNLAIYVDKVAVKAFVERRIGTQRVIPTLFAGPQLPPRAERNWPLPYVIKTNHGSGGNIFVREPPDWDTIEVRLNEMLACDFSAISGETFYGTINRQVLVEPFIAEGPDLPLDYKIFVCGGEPQFIQVDTDREHAHKRVFFDRDWNRLPIRLGYPDDPRPITRPINLEHMLELARKLAHGFGFVRVDFYEVQGRVLFGEMTFTPESGLMRFEPSSVDEDLGRLWPWPPTFPDPQGL